MPCCGQSWCSHREEQIRRADRNREQEQEQGEQESEERR